MTPSPSGSSVGGRNWLKSIGLYIAGLAALQIVFFGLLVVGQTVPDKPIVAHLAAAIHQGTYGPSGIPDRMGGISDTFTECVVVGTGLGSVNMNPFERAVSMPRISNCQLGKGEILKLAKGGQLAPKQVSDYYKYWAGYTVLTRPVLAWWGMDALRVISGALLVFAGGAAVFALARRTHAVVACTLVAPLLLASNVLSTPSTSFSQALSISAIALSCFLSAIWSARGLTWVVISSTLGAAIFCYVDLLTTPAIPWALAGTISAMVVYARTREIKATALSALAAFIIWPIAFGVTWVSRWIIAAAFLGIHKTTDFILKNVDFRTRGSYQGVNPAFGAPSAGNIDYWVTHFVTAPAVLTVAAICTVIALIIAIVRFGPRRLLLALAVAFPGLAIYIWYEALNNHSQIHEFFVYRGVPISVGIGLATAVFVALVPSADSRKKVHSKESAITFDSGDEAPRALHADGA